MYSDRTRAKGMGLCSSSVDENNVLLSLHLALNTLCIQKDFFLFQGKDCACLKNNALSTRCKYRILLLECAVIQVLMEWASSFCSLKTV